MRNWNLVKASVAGILCWAFLGTGLLATPTASAQEFIDEDTTPDLPEVPRVKREKIHDTNLLLIVVDGLRADHLGTYGYDRPTSPAIDALAKEGVVFERAYMAAANPIPALTSLLTSTWSCEHGMLNAKSQLARARFPITQRYHEAGLNPLLLTSSVYSYAVPPIGRAFKETVVGAPINGQSVDDVLTKQAQRPFLLMIHKTETSVPHLSAPEHTAGFKDVPQAVRDELAARLAQLAPKKKAGGRSDESDDKTPATGLEDIAAECVELYDSSVRLVDDHVASIIAALKEQGEWDNTLVVLTSDHGFGLGEHGEWYRGDGPYDELIHVPLIIRFPQSKFAGKRVSETVCQTDLLPTLNAALKLKGATANYNVRGRDLMPLVKGQELPGADDFMVTTIRMNPRKLITPAQRARGHVSVVAFYGPWKGIWHREPGTLELYNLDDDPGEQNDVAESNPELTLAMKAFARLWRADCSDKAPMRIRQRPQMKRLNR
ncbi:sulfatase [uncultured Ilyobacter sp.]|uniref:sulfatase family protein n=1 Tax=uncultured Ilyobacter sp. TaxID=544433 RepID=UPI0029F57588|nr:sulfatase [uncultured Ilyobacter sp.]